MRNKKQVHIKKEEKMNINTLHDGTKTFFFYKIKKQKMNFKLGLSPMTTLIWSRTHQVELHKDEQQEKRDAALARKEESNRKEQERRP